ncbi:MAG: Lrp/AsnC family transcriptional regulator [Armatimonadota bacterium]
MKFTSMEKKLLNILQDDFPVTERPYKKISEKVNITEAKVIDIIKKFKKKGLIRRITPSFNSDKTGRKVVLAACAVSGSKIKKTAEIINKFPEVTHNFLRDGEYNIWFTVSASSKKRLKDILKQIEAKTKLKLQVFPGVKTYKMNFTIKI